MFNLVKRPCSVDRRCDKMYSNRRMPTESEKGKRFKKEFQEKVRTFKDNSKNGGKTLLVRASPVGHSPTTLHTHEVTGSSPVVSTSQKTPPCWVVFFDSRKVRDSNPLQCDMPVAYHNSQFKNWLSPYEFALRQIQQSSPLVSTKRKKSELFPCGGWVRIFYQKIFPVKFLHLRACRIARLTDAFCVPL